MKKLDLSSLDDRNFATILKLQAEHNGEGNFLITDDCTITFSQAEDITNRLAAGLRALGVQTDDRVSLYMTSCPEMVLLALAVNKIRAVWVPINTEYKGEWLVDTLVRSRCRLLITDQESQQKITAIQSRLNGMEVVVVGDHDEQLKTTASYQQLLDHEPLTPDYGNMHYGDTCAILWTSGTTGKSKGVMQSYNAWIRAIQEGASTLYNSVAGDSIYCVLPLYNSGAWITCIFRALLEGIPVIIEKRFSVNKFWDRIRHFGATQTFAIGAMGTFLLSSPVKANDADNPLRVAQIVPMSSDNWNKFEQRFGVKLLRSGMGLSECFVVARQTEDRDDVPLHAVGFSANDAQLSLLDDDGNPVDDGQVGELAVKPLVPYIIFNGYFDSPEATAEAFHEDWFLTGDLGRKDPATGAFFFVDRKKDAIRYAGRNISTMEVESVAIRHPAVKEVAAYGITSEDVESEQELKISVVVEPGQSLQCEELCQFINDNAPYYFVPRFIQFTEALPYTPTNKLQKFLLREQGNDNDTWDLKQSEYKVDR